MTIELYLKENVDDSVVVKVWHEKRNVPIFLRNNYDFYEMNVLGTPCILMEVINEGFGIENIQKHIKQIRALTDRNIVLFYKNITRYRRKTLIKNLIPFLIEDGQMFLPFLGLDLKQAPENLEKEVKQFNTSAQLAYLYFLYHKNIVINVTEFAKKMGFSTMTASRALNDLYYTNLITYEIGGKTERSKKFKRIPDPDYFLKGRIYLKSPVKKTVYVKRVPLGTLIAGLDALAELSMINAPGQPVRAMHKTQFEKQKLRIINNKDLIKDAPNVELQLWDYDPNLFSDKDHVDILSLYASLKEEKDERIEQAIEEVLQGEPWYTE